MAVQIDAPNYSSDFAVNSWTFFAIAVFFVVLRCLARIQAVGIRKLELYDWLMKVALVGNKLNPSNTSRLTLF
jgi:hypothetical protein